jgi:HAD superfamily hydrolase (TIGR01509 family)
VVTPAPDASGVAPHPAPTGPAVGRLPAAVLWDMDGTVVDTEPCWMAAEQALAAEYGLTWTSADAVRLIGTALEDAGRLMQEHGVPLPAEEIVERLLDGVIARVHDHAEWQPGARELLVELRDAGVRCALVTMSYRRFTETVLADAPEGVFSVVLTGDEVENGKPHPEPYLRAAEALGLPISDCVAIEDSPPGIASALAAGLRTLGVQHIAPVEPRPGLSRVASLADVDLEDLARIHAGEVIDRLPAGTEPARHKHL